MVLARENTQMGSAAKAPTVDTKVMVIERSREPPKRYVHMLEPPPPGEQPVRKSPSHIDGSSENSPYPMAYDICTTEIFGNRYTSKLIL